MLILLLIFFEKMSRKNKILEVGKIDILAPEDGKVTKVLIKKYQMVNKGEPLFTMILDSNTDKEIQVKSPGTGKIFMVNVIEKQRFKKNQLLVRIYAYKQRRISAIYKELMGLKQFNNAMKEVKPFKFELKELSEDD